MRETPELTERRDYTAQDCIDALRLLDIGAANDATFHTLASEILDQLAPDVLPDSSGGVHALVAAFKAQGGRFDLSVSPEATDA